MQKLQVFNTDFLYSEKDDIDIKASVGVVRNIKEIINRIEVKNCKDPNKRLNIKQKKDKRKELILLKIIMKKKIDDIALKAEQYYKKHGQKYKNKNVKKLFVGLISMRYVIRQIKPILEFPYAITGSIGFGKNNDDEDFCSNITGRERRKAMIILLEEIGYHHWGMIKIIMESKRPGSCSHATLDKLYVQYSNSRDYRRKMNSDLGFHKLVKGIIPRSFLDNYKKNKTKSEEIEFYIHQRIRKDKSIDYKIGFSIEPSKRKRRQETQSGFKLKSIFTSYGFGDKKEKFAHKFLNKWRQNKKSEWFNDPGNKKLKTLKNIINDKNIDWKMF